MKVGLFGGTFNPVHIGHLRAAIEIGESFKLDKVYMIPAAMPPHKQSKDIVKASDRFCMLSIAVDDLYGLVCSDAELKRTGFSYTIDTIKYFQNLLPKNTQFYFIIGLDAFFEIDTWKSSKNLFSLIPFVIMIRPGEEYGKSDDIIKKIEKFIQNRISSKYYFSSYESCFVHSKMQSIFLTNPTSLDISSTKIRQLIRTGKSIKFLVPDNVEKFIRTKGLYL